jgi:hypothetical protein
VSILLITRMLHNRPRASRLRTSDVRAEREQRAGDATGRGDSAGGYAGVPAVFQRHTCVSRGDAVHEQEDPEVRERVSIANQSGPIGFSHKSTTSSSYYSSLIARARPQHLEETPRPPSSLFNLCMPKPHCHGKASYHHHGSPWGISLRPSSTHYNPLTSFFVLPTPKPHHCRALLIADPVPHGNSLSTHSPPQPRLPQGLPWPTESS